MNKDYQKLKRLNNKRSHAIASYEDKPSKSALELVLKFVRLLSSQIKKMDSK